MKNKLWPVKLTVETKQQLESIPYLKALYFFVCLNIGSIALILILKNNLPPQVPLFYGIANKETQLAPLAYLIIPNSIALILIFLNILLALFIDDTFLKKVLAIAGFAVSLLATITTLKIMLLVGSF